MENLNKKSAFTIIELIVVTAIIGLLAATVTPKLLKEIRKGKVAKIQHNLGVIRSRISLDEILDKYPNLENSDTLKSQYQIKETLSFTNNAGSFIDATNKIVTLRNNTGGWVYNRENGEIYANLPNGAYTKDSNYEIWSGEIVSAGAVINAAQNLEDVNGVKAMDVSDSGDYINNGSFEGVDVGIYSQVDASLVNHWETTASDNKIEVWGDGFLGVNGVDGGNFVELNANEVASLYQDVVTVPGTILRWTVSHRARGDGNEVATISVGGDNSSLEVQETMESGKFSRQTSSNGWVTYTQEYEVPDGQTVTRFSLDSLGGGSSGNLIDNFSVELVLPSEE
ncbi:MAG: type II secretion system protein [Psychrilyobacter sp.]|uniref:type II secretion system protein n=1 Tax=Psychrilyobacter sp. TaxID=2586924 RepID=UPI003C77218E